MTITEQLEAKWSEWRDVNGKLWELRRRERQLMAEISDLWGMQLTEAYPNLKPGDTVYIYETPHTFVGLPKVMKEPNHIVVKPEKGRRYEYHGPWALQPFPRPIIRVDDLT